MQYLYILHEHRVSHYDLEIAGNHERNCGNVGETADEDTEFQTIKRHLEIPASVSHGASPAIETYYRDDPDIPSLQERTASLLVS